MENSVDKQELLDQFEQWRIDDGLPGEYSARPRQADDGQAADGPKRVTREVVIASRFCVASNREDGTP